jgi:ribosomal-protein-alanine N-acetyltransferase
MGPILTGSSYEVRRFEKGDLQRIMQINFECLPENYSSYFYLGLFEKYPETFLVADTSDEVQGYIMCRIERSWSKTGRLRPVKLCHIVSVAVMEKYRRQGIATSLIVEAMKNGRDSYGTTEGYLEVRASNKPAINLYKKLGFDQVKRNFGYYMDGEDAWVMATNLEHF